MASRNASTWSSGTYTTNCISASGLGRNTFNDPGRHPTNSANFILTPSDTLSKFVWIAYNAIPLAMAAMIVRSTYVLPLNRFNPLKTIGWWETIMLAPTAMASSTTASVQSKETNTADTASDFLPTSRPELSYDSCNGSGAHDSSAVVTSRTVNLFASCMHQIY